MIEEIIINYLNSVMDVEACSEKQAGKTSYLLVGRTGGSQENHIETATIVIQSYGASRYKAAELNKRMKEKMKDIIQLDSISSCKLNTDYDYTDTTTKEYRYQAVFDVVYY